MDKVEVRIITEQTDLDAAFHIREVVFVDEQNTPLEEEFDERDDEAEHILVLYEGKPVGTGRLRMVEGVAKLERICVLATHRKYGLGKVIVETLEHIGLDKGATSAKLHGQTQAEAFYIKLGYQTASDVFMEDGIPHVLMTKNL
ncbi:GNAT family N-acetyltransferase [Bacillus horti]|uniref:GNAT family N-acyltransferase n=1 Tax=Caldalkalibacillus horti TaxID=77523 RepID=A0ABT9VXG3_9BACI|nr:GNAT family N-acetyltransferase [Bacillus horti]MDQ0165681.1 putative GNAT family N-acyltransferase [Bacillus horti]